VPCALDYRKFAESANFHQFEAAIALPLPPVDLMLVDDEVFVLLERTTIASESLVTPTVVAMISLKLYDKQFTKSYKIPDKITNISVGILERLLRRQDRVRLPPLVVFALGFLGRCLRPRMKALLVLWM
jgi:hypothetical protein